jgi:hypothetical protein
MPVVDVVFVLATQARHLLHQRLGIPHLDLLDPQTHLDVLPDQARRHRIGVVPYLDGAAAADPHPPAVLGLQPPRRQGPQRQGLRREGALTLGVALPQQLAQEGLVVRAARKIPTAAQ